MVAGRYSGKHLKATTQDFYFSGSCFGQIAMGYIRSNNISLEVTEPSIFLHYGKDRAGDCNSMDL